MAKETNDINFRKWQLIVSALLLLFLVGVHAYLILQGQEGLSIFIFGLVGILGGFDLSDWVNIKK